MSEAGTGMAASKGLAQRSLSAHAAIGLLASALLYVVAVTGTLLVFYEEWQRVEQPDAPEMAAVSPAAVQAAMAQVLASEKGRTPTEHFYVHMPTQGLPRTTVTTDNQAVHVDASGRVVAPEENGWSEFLLELHYMLNIPGLIGASIVGALGVMMLALSLTGVLAHPRIFRDAFRLRARDSNGLGIADWHNRLGVWTLPFSIAISLTGAMIALAGLNAYGLAQGFYGGDTEAAYAPIFGEEGPHDPAPAPLPNVALALHALAAEAPAARPTYVVIHEPGTAGQMLQIIAAHERRLIYGETYMFSANGRPAGKLGMSDGSVGKQVAGSSYNLHFGNYGGLPVKIAYALFGTALCVVIAVGVFIWIGKRERRGYAHPRISNGWHAVVWGTPLALCLTFLARFMIGNEAPFIWLFWLSLAGMIGMAMAFPMRVKRLLQLLLTISLLGGGIAAASAARGMM